MSTNGKIYASKVRNKSTADVPTEVSGDGNGRRGRRQWFSEMLSRFYAAKKRRPDWDLGFTLASFGPAEPPFLRVEHESTARPLPAVARASSCSLEGKYPFGFLFLPTVPHGCVSRNSSSLIRVGRFLSSLSSFKNSNDMSPHPESNGSPIIPNFVSPSAQQRHSQPLAHFAPSMFLSPLPKSGTPAPTRTKFPSPGASPSPVSDFSLSLFPLHNPHHAIGVSKTKTCRSRFTTQRTVSYGRLA